MEGASGGTRPESQALGAHQHTYCSHLKHVFKQNLNRNMLKNAYFFEKKNRHASLASRCLGLLQLRPVRF